MNNNPEGPRKREVTPKTAIDFLSAHSTSEIGICDVASCALEDHRLPNSTLAQGVAPERARLHLEPCSIPPQLALVADYPGKELPLARLRGIRQVQRQVQLSDEDKISGEAKTGYWFIDKCSQLRDKLSKNSNYQVLTLEDHSGRVWGFYLYQIVSGPRGLREAKGDLGKFLGKIYDERRVKVMGDFCLSIDNEVVVDPRVELPVKLESRHRTKEVVNKGGLGLDRRTLSKYLHAYCIEELRQKGVVAAFATCWTRPVFNPAHTIHGLCGWRVLDPNKYSLVKPDTVNGFREEIDVEASILWLDTRSSLQDRLIEEAKHAMRLFNLDSTRASSQVISPQEFEDWRAANKT